MRKYEVSCIHWRPKIVTYEIEAENDTMARTEAKRRCEEGDIQTATSIERLPVKVTMHRYRRIRD